MLMFRFGSSPDSCVFEHRLSISSPRTLTRSARSAASSDASPFVPAYRTAWFRRS